MKKKKILVGVSSLLLLLGLGACGGKDNPGGGGEATDKRINATIDRQILSLDNDDSAKITCSLEGVTYRSSDERIVEVDSKGNIDIVDKGDAFVTVSKQGYFDKVFKIHVDKDNSVDYLVEGFEFGPAITGVKLSLPAPITQQALQAASFSVKTNNGSRTINQASLCDIEGQIINATESKYVRFDLATTYTSMGIYGSVQDAASCFTYANNVNNWRNNITAEVTVNSALQLGDKSVVTGTRINSVRARVTLSTRDWGEAKSHTAEGYTLTYKAYEVDALRNDGVKNPLIIWLHGMGEGGTDPDIALLGNDVTALSERSIQSHFVNGDQKGAYVLAVQTPTYWMNSGTGGINGGVGHSIYTKTLKSTIDYFVEHNLDIDTKRIYIGGCSNGGYMTMEMAVTYGNYFRAFYPCCEAYSDSFVTDEDIQKLKELPIWFIHAATDTTVNASSYVIPTYQRLMRAGAKDVHFSYFTKVTGHDCSTRENEYMGHYSWIYIFRDEVSLDQVDPEHVAAPSTEEVKVDKKVVNLFDWMETKK